MGVFLVNSAWGASYPLHDAVKAGNLTLVKASLNSNRVNQRNYAGMTPLMLAAIHDRSTSAKMLINAGARLEDRTAEYGTTALMLAAVNDHYEVVEVLAQRGADLNARNNSGFTAMMLAASKGHARVVRVLLQYGASTTVRDAFNGTALTHASTAEVRNLLSGSPARQKTSTAAVSSSAYPLHDAVKAGRPNLVKAALNSTRVNQRNGAGMTPLMLAALHDRSTSAQLLIDAGARLEERTQDYGTTALMLAATNGYHEVVEVLVQRGAYLNARNKPGFTALMLAAQNGHAQVVQILLQYGADPSVRDENNLTALEHAATAEVRNLLIPSAIQPQAGNPVTIGEEAGSSGGTAEKKITTPIKTPAYSIHKAVEDDNLNALNEALAATGSLEQRDSEGFTPLMLAARWNRMMAAHLLIEAGADVNAAMPDDGTTVMMLAARAGYHGVVEELLRGGAGINAVDKFHSTALIQAAKGGHEAVVCSLLQYGADKTISDSYGKTAADYASIPEIKRLLQ